MILGKWTNWCTILFYIFISILYMFRANPCSSPGKSIVSIQPLVYVTLCQWPFCVQVGKELQFLSDLHTKRSPTQSDIYQRLYWYNWFSWWRARVCSKHVENWNKYIEKNCASSWSFTKILFILVDSDHISEAPAASIFKTVLLGITKPVDRTIQWYVPE